METSGAHLVYRRSPTDTAPYLLDGSHMAIIVISDVGLADIHRYISEAGRESADTAFLAAFLERRLRSQLTAEWKEAFGGLDLGAKATALVPLLPLNHTGTMAIIHHYLQRLASNDAYARAWDAFEWTPEVLTLMAEPKFVDYNATACGAFSGMKTEPQHSSTSTSGTRAGSGGAKAKESAEVGADGSVGGGKPRGGASKAGKHPTAQKPPAAETQRQPPPPPQPAMGDQDDRGAAGRLCGVSRAVPTCAFVNHGVRRVVAHAHSPLRRLVRQVDKIVDAAGLSLAAPVVAYSTNATTAAAIDARRLPSERWRTAQQKKDGFGTRVARLFGVATRTPTPTPTSAPVVQPGAVVMRVDVVCPAGSGAPASTPNASAGAGSPPALDVDAVTLRLTRCVQVRTLVADSDGSGEQQAEVCAVVSEWAL
jgi:hypothetical protein